MLMTLTKIRNLLMGSAGMGSLVVMGLPAAFADCPNCQRGAISHSAPAPHYSEPIHSEPIHSGSHISEPISSPPPSSGFIPHYQADSGPPPAPMQNPAYKVVPPPGTLGNTYYRKSWLIPKDEHPRTAIIEISAPGFTKLDVIGLADLEGFQRKDGIWIFKTEKPLISGNPHIYEVHAG